MKRKERVICAKGNTRARDTGTLSLTMDLDSRYLVPCSTRSRDGYGEIGLALALALGITVSPEALQDYMVTGVLALW